MQAVKSLPQPNRSPQPQEPSPTSPATSRTPPPPHANGTDVRTRTTRSRANPLRRLDVRLGLGVLGVALPLLAITSALLVSGSSTSLTHAAERKAEATARSVALRLEDWMSERREDLAGVAALASGAEDRASIAQ